MYEYIENFKKLGFGMFVHFGLYSICATGEWSMRSCGYSKEEFQALMDKFTVDPDWAKKLVKTAKDAGCKYITLTTRHHDGFSLYDTKGLNEYDAPHSACSRDLVREFVDACNSAGLIPFFYHTLMDWWHKDYYDNVPAYIDYLCDSIKILCTNYGKIGGFWFDGLWDPSKTKEDWQESRIYGLIHSLQPDAMVINNTGLSALGEVGHPELDSVTFERGKPSPVKAGAKPIAGEVCQIFKDHWGYAANDIAVRPLSEHIETLIDCRKYRHNLLLNVGPLPDGNLTLLDQAMFEYVGKWIHINKDFIYDVYLSDIQAENADILTDGNYYYATVKDVPTFFNANVTLPEENKKITLKTTKKIIDGEWLDCGEKLDLAGDNAFYSKPFAYGTSLCVRVAKLKLTEE